MQTNIKNKDAKALSLLIVNRIRRDIVKPNGACTVRAESEGKYHSKKAESRRKSGKDDICIWT